MTTESSTPQQIVVDGLARTRAARRMRAAFTVSYGELRDEWVQWEALGALDLETGLSRLKWRKPSKREQFMAGTAIHLRLSADSDTWSEIRGDAPNESSLTDDLFGMGRLVAAGSMWEPAGSVALRDGTDAQRYIGRLPQRLGEADDGTVREVLAERLPFAVGRRRLVEAWIDDKGFLRGIAVTTSGAGLRRKRKWIALEVSDLGVAEVRPPKDATVLRGGPMDQIRQRWAQVRSSP